MATCNTRSDIFAASAWSMVEVPDSSTECNAFSGEQALLRLAPFDTPLNELCTSEKYKICWSSLDVSFEEDISEIFVSCGDQRLVRGEDLVVTFTTPCTPCVDATNGNNLIADIKDARDSGERMRFALELPDGNQYIGAAYMTGWNLQGLEEDGDLLYGATATVECPTEIRCGKVLPTSVAVFPLSTEGGGDVEIAGIQLLAGTQNIFADSVVGANQNAGDATANLNDGDSATSWNGGAVAGSPFISLTPCYPTPYMNQVCFTVPDTGTAGMPTSFNLAVNTGAGGGWMTVSTASGIDWSTAVAGDVVCVDIPEYDISEILGDPE